MVDPEAKRPLQKALRETWMHALGVITGAEGEVARAAHRVLEAVGLSTDAEAKGPTRELFARFRRNRALFEQRVDEGVKAAVARVRLPLAQEIALLRGRVEKLQKSVEEFKRRRSTPEK
ncbi:MAG: hypothetical protein EXR72_24945 [Myxococcales bacterium]|nr:hypothetical protein [Myxococcales bacterium]